MIRRHSFDKMIQWPLQILLRCRSTKPSDRSYGDVLTILLSDYNTIELDFDRAYIRLHHKWKLPRACQRYRQLCRIKIGCLSEEKTAAWGTCDSPIKHTSHGCESLEVPNPEQFHGDHGSYFACIVMDDPINVSNLFPLGSSTVACPETCLRDM